MLKFLKVFFYFSLLIIVNSLFKEKDNTNNPGFEIETFLSWNLTTFKIHNKYFPCKNCIPSQIRFNSNGTLFCSFPHIYGNISSTFAVYNKTSGFFEPWPPISTNCSEKEEEEENNDDEENLNVEKWVESFYYNYDLNDNETENDTEKFFSEFYSVMGFEIDEEDNIYILDQGKTKKKDRDGENYAFEKSPRLLIYNNTNQLIKEIFLNRTNLNLSPSSTFLANLVVDKQNNLVYISNSGSNINHIGNISEYNPNIIIVNIDNNETQKIFSQHFSLMPDKTFSLYINNLTKKINPSLSTPAGLNALSLSCDGKYLFYFPLFSRMIYSIKTEEITNAFGGGKDIKDSMIKINQGFKNEPSDTLLTSGRGNLFMTGIETGTVYIIRKVDEEFLRLEYNEFSNITEKWKLPWPSSLTIYNESLYVLSKKMEDYANNDDSENNNFTIYKINIDKYKDNNYIKGCKGFKYKLRLGSFVLWILFIFVIFVVLCFVFVDSGNPEEDKNSEIAKKLK